MITIRNTQRKIKINIKKFKNDAQLLLNALGYNEFDLGIMFVNNTTMQKYNRQYRAKDKPTDVLSFPFHPHIKAGENIVVQFSEDQNLGDLIFAPEYIMNDLPKWETTFERHLQRLLVHGICHLLGYDHIKNTDFKIMDKKEKELLHILQCME